MNRKKLLLAALVLIALGVFSVLAALAFTGCNYFDLGEPIEEWQPSQGVLTVKGLEDGSHYEAEVYDYPDDDVADAADLANLMSVFELAAIGLGTVGNGTLELTLLVPPEGEFFTADGSFLVVLKVAKNDSAPLMYKGAVPFTGGSATVEYDEMETAIRRYTVTFDLNYTGATNPPKPQEIASGGKVTLPSPSPTREGYTLGGWYTSKDYATKWDFDAHTVTTDINLYAKWLDNSISYYIVTFDLNYTGAPNPPANQEIGEGGRVTQPAVPVRTGYTFDGWYTSTVYATKWDFALNTVTADITLYARWLDNSIIYRTVTFHTNGGTSADFTQTVADGDKAKEPETAPEREGHTFDGWYTSTAYATKWDFDKDTVTTDLHLYAKWTRNQYTVTFKDDSAVLSTQTVAHGSTATRPAEDPAKDGAWAFDNWYTANGGSTLFNFNTVITGHTEIFAGWLPTYTVTFNLNGATGTAPAHPAVLYEGKITLPDPAPQWAGWIFEAWYKEAACTNPWNFVTDTVTENITLYAKWAVWLLSTETDYTPSNGTIFSETTTEYTSYTDETHYTYNKQSIQLGTTIYEYEMSRNGESEHEVTIVRSANGMVDTSVYDRVYDTDSGLIKQQTTTTTHTSSSGVTGTPSVTEYFHTITLLNTDVDGTKTYKYSTVGYDFYRIYTIKDGVTLSDVSYGTEGSLVNTKTYTFPDNPVIRERLPDFTLYRFTSELTPSYSDYETCELLASTDTSLTVRIKTFYTSTNVWNDQVDQTYTKITLPSVIAASG